MRKRLSNTNGPSDPGNGSEKGHEYVDVDNRIAVGVHSLLEKLSIESTEQTYAWLCETLRTI